MLKVQKNMPKTLKLIRSLLPITVIFTAVTVSSGFGQNEITLTTTMPRQDELRVKRGVVGDGPGGSWDYGDVALTDDNLFVGGNLAVGTTAPQSPSPDGATTGNLDVNDAYLRSTGEWMIGRSLNLLAWRQYEFDWESPIWIKFNQPCTLFTVDISAKADRKLLVIWNLQIRSETLNNCGLYIDLSVDSVLKGRCTVAANGKTINKCVTQMTVLTDLSTASYNLKLIASTWGYGSGNAFRTWIGTILVLEFRD